MPKVRVGDVGMYYVEAGVGEPLVLIMGFGGDHLSWGLQVPAFAERYRVVAFDNRGAGQTDQPDGPYSIRQMATDTIGLMDALGIERAHVLGVSMGGMIAQEVALTQPARVRSLQLHCTLARPDRYLAALLDWLRATRPRLSQEETMRGLAPWIFAPRTYNERPDFVELILQSGLANPHRQSVAAYLGQAAAVAGHDTLDRLGAIRGPTLVSVAEEDILVPPRFAREIAARIPGAELRIIPDAGHVYFWERPDVFNEMCLEFLARASPA